MGDPTAKDVQESLKKVEEQDGKKLIAKWDKKSKVIKKMITKLHSELGSYMADREDEDFDVLSNKEGGQVAQQLNEIEKDLKELVDMVIV